MEDERSDDGDHEDDDQVTKETVHSNELVVNRRRGSQLKTQEQLQENFIPANYEDWDSRKDYHPGKAAN